VLAEVCLAYVIQYEKTFVLTEEHSMQNSHVAVIGHINEVSLSQLTHCGVFPTFFTR